MLPGMSADQPWLDYRPWATNSIASDARGAHWVLWAIAFFWNLVTLPLYLQSGKIWEQVQREPLTALVALFPLVGLVLVVMAAVATRQRRRFGLTPLVMDPFPGSLGGQPGNSFLNQLGLLLLESRLMDGLQHNMWVVLSHSTVT